MKVAIYSRVSTRDKHQNPENQARELRAWCDRQGFEVFREYAEEVSGSRSRTGRQAFDDMFEDASRRKFDLVLFWALDRFSREGTYETISHLRQLQDFGVEFHSYTEPFLCTDNEFARDLLLSVLSALAKQERVRQSERVKAGQDRARAQGKRIGRPKLSAEVTSRIPEMLKDGKSKAAIARELGVPRSTLAAYFKEL